MNVLTWPHPANVTVNSKSVSPAAKSWNQFGSLFPSTFTTTSGFEADVIAKYANSSP